MLDIMFWTLIIMIFYTYFGYPLILWILTIFLSKPVKKKDITPYVSLIIPAHNEEKVIQDKIDNSLLLDYPREKLEIIIVSDGSFDKTEKIIKENACKTGIVKPVCYPNRQGKAFAINRGVSEAKGEIIVFSDANVRYKESAIKMLVRNFNDRSVGAVSGKVVVKSNPNTEGAGLDSLYDSFIRECQSKIGTMLGADGAMYAIRKEFFSELDKEVIVDDFIIPVKIVEKGYRTVYEKDAIGFEETSDNVLDEFKRKSRIIAGGYQAIGYIKAQLAPFSRRSIFFHFMSCKFLLWIMPFFLILVFLLNLFLSAQGNYLVFLVLQIAFYSIALTGALVDIFGKSSVKSRFLAVPYYFCCVNIAAIVGLYKFIYKKQKSTWVKAERHLIRS